MTPLNPHSSWHVQVALGTVVVVPSFVGLVLPSIFTHAFAFGMLNLVAVFALHKLVRVPPHSKFQFKKDINVLSLHICCDVG